MCPRSPRKELWQQRISESWGESVEGQRKPEGPAECKALPAGLRPYYIMRRSRCGFLTLSLLLYSRLTSGDGGSGILFSAAKDAAEGARPRRGYVQKHRPPGATGAIALWRAAGSVSRPRWRYSPA